ncbi:MAG: ATP/GTP-binding protein [Solirubrobacteraceae bacterium]
MVYLQAPGEWRGTTFQVCGLWPFAPGVGLPMVGVPLGPHLYTGRTVCADPISLFMAKVIGNPSAFILGLPGLGKSSLIKRIATGLAAFGVMPLVLGDLKPDYVDLIRAMEGQVIPIGRGRGHLNILDSGGATAAAARLTGQSRTDVLADALGRRHTMVCALVAIARKCSVSDHEETIVDRALRILDDRHEGIPVLPDLLQVINDAPDDLRVVALDRGDLNRYLDLTDNLRRSLQNLLTPGSMGEIFSGPTTVAMRRDVPVVFDISSIDHSQRDLRAAALMACWSYGFAAVNIAHALADAGLERPSNQLIVLDELWQALAVGGAGIVDRVNYLTRLDRTEGVGVIMCSHTMSDLSALSAQEDRDKARGFVERAGMIILGGLPGAEMPLLTPTIRLSQAEQNLLMSWDDPAPWDSTKNRAGPRPGLGHFLVKLGGGPGIPIAVELTPRELNLHDTNQRWGEASRIRVPEEEMVAR